MCVWWVREEGGGGQGERKREREKERLSQGRKGIQLESFPPHQEAKCNLSGAEDVSRLADELKQGSTRNWRAATIKLFPLLLLLLLLFLCFSASLLLCFIGHKVVAPRINSLLNDPTGLTN